MLERHSYRITAYILAWTGACLAALKPILIKLLFEESVSTNTVLFIRTIFSLPIYLIVAAYYFSCRRSFLPNKSQWKSLIILGFIGYYLASLLDLVGLRYITASLEVLVLFLYPTLVTVFSYLVYKEKTSRSVLSALVLSYAGIFIAFAGDENIEKNYNLVIGGAFVFSSAICFSVYVLLSGQLVKSLGSMVVSSTTMLFSSLFVFIHFFVTESFNIYDSLNLSLNSYALLALLSIVCTALPIFLLLESVKRIGAVKTSITGCVSPVLTIIFASRILSESVTNTQILGTVLVLAGAGYLVTIKSKTA